MQLSLGGFEEALRLPKHIDVTQHAFGKTKVAIHEGEFWTSKQRDGHSIHEVSYRACYKPQLPGYFITRHAAPGSVVFDPFLGRGTTLIEARLHGCRTIGSDVNPLSLRLALPRLRPPALEQVKDRLNSAVLSSTEIESDGLLEFFHPDTLQEIQGWMGYFQQRRELGLIDGVDEWIEMVAANRLTGHSNGFFSVYTLPPNQAVSVDRQKKINAKLKQRPEYRNTRLLILKKTRSLLRDDLPDGFSDHAPKLFQASAAAVPQVASNSVDLVVTSPPFLDEVDYLQDNWMRMWFCGITLEKSSLWQLRSIPEWTARMEDSLRELRRVLKKGGVIAFEVGEVRRGTVRLELEIVSAGMRAGLVPEKVIINSQSFTKTSNCWGVDNNKRGTNSNRIVVFRK
jgi:DNA methylase